MRRPGRKNALRHLRQPGEGRSRALRGGTGGRYFECRKVGRVSRSLSRAWRQDFPDERRWPEELRVDALEHRLAKGGIDEVIIALGTDVEGDATSHYLAKRLANRDVEVSRIAHGLPAGTGLEYADELTLSQALEGRRELEV